MSFSNVSVIIPVYNASRFLKKAVDSVLQFPEVSEVILAEDASKDNSFAVCKSLENKNDKVKVFIHPGHQNKGAGASRNLGIEKAKGDFIAFLDADDYYLPNRFDAERELFKNPEVDGVYGATGVHFYSEKAKRTFREKFKTENPEAFLTTLSEAISPEKLFHNIWRMGDAQGYFTIDTLTMRASVLKKKPQYFTEELRLHQDTEFLYRMAYECRLYPGIIDKAVAVRGVHEENRSIDQSDLKRVWENQYRMYKVMHDWAKERKVEKVYQQMFKEKMLLYRYKLSSAFQKPGVLLLYFLNNPLTAVKKIVR